MNLTRLGHGSVVRRRITIGIYGLLLFAALCSTGIIAGILLTSPKPDLAVRLAEVGDLLTSGTVILALIAGLVALQAYASATGLPKLEIQIWFRYSYKNSPMFNAANNGDRLETTTPHDQTVAMVLLRNRSSYSARNPAVIIRLEAIESRVDNGIAHAQKSWNIFRFPDESVGERDAPIFQWDGGGDYSIHGRSARRLPDIDLGVLFYRSEWGMPRMRIELLADGGYRRNLEVTVRFRVDEHSPSISSINGIASEWL